MLKIFLFFPPLESLFMLFHSALCPRKLILMDSIKGLAPPLTADLVWTNDPPASGRREGSEVVNLVPWFVFCRVAELPWVSCPPPPKGTGPAAVLLSLSHGPSRPKGDNISSAVTGPRLCTISCNFLNNDLNFRIACLLNCPQNTYFEYARCLLLEARLTQVFKTYTYICH